MLYREINAVCSPIHTKHINTHTMGNESKFGVQERSLLFSAVVTKTGVIEKPHSVLKPKCPQRKTQGVRTRAVDAWELSPLWSVYLLLLCAAISNCDHKSKDSVIDCSWLDSSQK
jgi:hypothetical protein